MCVRITAIKDSTRSLSARLGIISEGHRDFLATEQGDNPGGVPLKRAAFLPCRIVTDPCDLERAKGGQWPKGSHKILTPLLILGTGMLPAPTVACAGSMNADQTGVSDSDQIPERPFLHSEGLPDGRGKRATCK